MTDPEPSAYEELGPFRQLAIGAAGAANPVAGMLLAAVDAQIEQKAKSKNDSTAWAITEALHKGIGLRTYENIRTLADQLIDVEGYLPPELVQSDSFMRSLAVCAELSARAEDNRKVRYLFNLLMRGVTDQQALNLERDYEFYAQILTELSITELHMIVRLVEHPDRPGPNVSLSQARWAFFIEELSDELAISREDLNARFQSITRTPVFAIVYPTSGAMLGGGPGAQRKVTTIGYRLMEYIKEIDWQQVPRKTEAPRL